MTVDAETARDAELVDRWIRFYAGRPAPDEARLEEYGTPIWALIGHLPAAGGDIALVAEDYQLPLEAVEAAVAYYRGHQLAIDAKLAANAAYST